MSTSTQAHDKGREELLNAMRSARSLFISVAIFSFFVNLLMLTGPLFMLQVYDRVLTSRSEQTLAALFILVAGLFLCMGILDYIRARVLSRAGARFQSLLDTRVFQAVMTRSLSPADRAKPATGLRDLESIQRLLSGPAPFAIFDAPWTPIYLAAIFFFHVYLGYLALAGALILFVLAILNELLSKSHQRKALEAQVQAENFENALRREAETLQALGMRNSVADRWRKRRDAALDAQIAATDRTGAFSATSKTLRFFLQSAILALGAWLAIYQEVSPGAMIAASILLGRALAPVEQAIGQWSSLQRARQGWRSLSELLTEAPQPAPRLPLPKPSGLLSTRNLAVAPPGIRTPVVRGLSFAAQPGEAVGVIGPSGSGKSCLARTLAGVWPPLAGDVRLDGAALDQWEADALGANVGYLPQDVALMDGTVAENIARFAEDADPDEVIAAAQLAGAHELILGLQDGYDTRLGLGGAAVSGGQRQRIALARALFGDPAMMVLDEPNSNLDAAGEQALLKAIVEMKQRGRSVIVIAHRPSAIAACDKVLMIDQGQQRAFGPRDEVLRQTTQNYPQLVKGGQAAPQTAAGGPPAQG